MPRPLTAADRVPQVGESLVSLLQNVEDGAEIYYGLRKMFAVSQGWCVMTRKSYGSSWKTVGVYDDCDRAVAALTEEGG